MKTLYVILALFLMSDSVHAGVDYACFKACKEDGESMERCKEICSTPESIAPPQQVGGGAARNLLGQVMCGPGQCIQDRLGVVYCSSAAGGSATTNLLGQAVCVGGCVRGTAEYCRNPQ